MFHKIRPFLMIAIVGIALGLGISYWLKPVWISFEPTDKAFRASFAEHSPVSMSMPKPQKYTFAKDDLLKVYSSRTPRGLDEINRLDEFTSAQADVDWFDATVRETKARLITGNAGDFSLELAEGMFLRGRVFFSPDGKGLYKVFVIRGTSEDLESPSVVRFLYGVDFPKNDPVSGA